MKKIFLATSALLALSTAALAADLPGRKAAPAPVFAAPVFTWAGLYVGANVGYVALDSKSHDVNGWSDLVSSTKTKAHGAIGGAQIGYNFQTGAFVYGVETDIAFASAKKSTGFTDIGPGHIDAEMFRNELTALGTLRARAGVAFDRTLLYVTGGLAYGKVKNSWAASWSYSPTETYNIVAQSDKWRFGWTVGAGVEQALSNNWTVKLEGLYYDLGKKNIAALETCDGVDCGVTNVYAQRVKNDGWLIRAGLNYKFGAPAPVVAKY